MDTGHIQRLQTELSELLRKQRQILESRMLGTASETDLLEYEIRQEIVHEMCNQLVRAISR